MVTHEKDRGQVTVRLSGELDHAAAQRIRPQVDRLLEDESVRRLVFDLEGLNFMDSSGIGVILGRYRIMNRRGGQVWVKSVGRQVDKIFAMAGLYQLVNRM